MRSSSPASNAPRARHVGDDRTVFLGATLRRILFTAFEIPGTRRERPARGSRSPISGSRPIPCTRPCSTILFGKRRPLRVPAVVRRSRKFASPAETRAELALLGRSLGERGWKSCRRAATRCSARESAGGQPEVGAAAPARPDDWRPARKTRARRSRVVADADASSATALLGSALGPGELSSWPPRPADDRAAGLAPVAPGRRRRAACREKRGRPVSPRAASGRSAAPRSCRNPAPPPFSFRGLLRRTWLSEIHPTADRALRATRAGRPP